MLYLCLKYIHVIAAIFLFGFGMGSYLYLIAASRTANPQVIAHVARTVVRFDTWITTPAGFIQIVTGYLLTRLAGLPLTTEWIMTSLIIFLCVGTLWLPVLVFQKRLYVMASSAARDGHTLEDRYSTVYRKWFWMGVLGFLGMFVIVLIMVTKMTPQQWVERLLV
ncbi:Uncharacterized membrane protein [Pseudomonas sp. NFACC15-1]|uniref:DUF2269 family protein n=1 Tax=unclassified Pseudomonas TaxID=196821 RepID=UPI00088A398A|nr:MULTISPECIES: DUF2269 domain-containing protein [unclassified Pseudomonas]SDA91874.1 Uncharacterized membrane protein [Pseudomonas sp. NFACC15-1]SDZ02906.1 Uncharacterized membrane protein [Pseudomonas sp. NFACC14]